MRLGVETIAASRALLDATADGPGARVAILVSLGSAGAVLVPRDGEPVDIRAPRVPAVDATGAGDGLNGALAAALADGMELEAAARRAVVAASLSVTRVGRARGLSDGGGARGGPRRHAAVGQAPPSAATIRSTFQRMIAS